MGCTSSSQAAYEPTEYTLTSEAIEKTPDNNYPWHVCDWLIPHEPLRRDMLRTERAIELLNVVDHPWHIQALYKWLSDYLLRAVHFHHDNEESIVGPYYSALGESIDFGKTADHDSLVKMMQSFGDDVKALLDLVTEGKSEASILTVKEADLKTKWAAFHRLMSTHLAEEEVFWPPVYAKHGEKHGKITLNLILKKEFKLKGKDAIAGNAFAGSVVDALGLFQERYVKYGYTTPTHARSFGPWCSIEFRKKFYSEVPSPVRLFIFPGYHKKYVDFCKLVDSIGGLAPPADIKI